MPQIFLISFKTRPSREARQSTSLNTRQRSLREWASIGARWVFRKARICSPPTSRQRLTGISALEPAAKAENAKLGSRPRGRFGVIEQLERIGEILGWDMVPGSKQPKLRDRPITSDVINALAQKGALGPVLVSHVEPPDGRQRKDLKFRPLGGTNVDLNEGVPEEHDETVFGFHDPSHLTDDGKSNARKLKRKFAFASKFGAPAVLRTDPVTWHLDDQPRKAIENAEPFMGGVFQSLRSVRNLLAGQEGARKNLAVTARRAARFLEIEFAMTDRNRNNQSHETIASWTKPNPFAEFGIALFEVLAPTRNGESLPDILMPDDIKGDLKQEAVDLVLEGAQHARRVFGILQGRLRAHGIDIPEAHLVDPDDADEDLPGPLQAHYLDRGSPVMRISEDIRDTTGRLNEGRRRTLEQLWRLRDNSVKLRALTEMFFAYHEQLLDRGGNYGPLRNEMLEKIANPTLDWYRELGARFDEGVVYKSDIKRRSGGLPNGVPDVPSELERYQMKLQHYPAIMAWGAQRHDAVIEAVLTALDTSGDAWLLWKTVSAIVNEDAG